MPLLAFLLAAPIHRAAAQASTTQDTNRSKSGAPRKVPRPIPGVASSKVGSKSPPSFLEKVPKTGDPKSEIAKIVWVQRGPAVVADAGTQPASPAVTTDTSGSSSGTKDYSPTAPQVLRVLTSEEAAHLVQQLSQTQNALTPSK